MHDMAVSLLGPSRMSNRPRICRTRKRKTPEPCIIGAVSSLTNLPTSTKSIDGPNRGHGNHHGRVAASCIARVPVADVEIIAARRPGRRSRQFAVATLACWLIAQLPPAPSPRQLWLSGLRSGCGDARRPYARGRRGPDAHDSRGSNRSGKTTAASSEAGHVTRTWYRPPPTPPIS
jgi:hypothetical protein